MKEFIEKLIGRLEEQKTDAIDKWDGGASHKAYSKAIEIVNQLAEEYKDKEYCWQECASTENCKECSRLGNGDIDYFESIDDWSESLPTIDAGELFGNGWIPCSERLPEDNDNVNVTILNGNELETATAYYDCKWFVCPKDDYDFYKDRYEVFAWQPLPAPYKPKGE